MIAIASVRMRMRTLACCFVQGCTAPLKRLVTVLSCAVIAWLLAAVLAYRSSEGWDTVHALFFAVNVGFGIGYGFPRCATVPCKIYTSFHCLLGASFIMGALLLGFGMPLEWQYRAAARSAGTPRRARAPTPCAALSRWVVERRYRLLLLIVWVLYMALGVAATLALGVIEGPVKGHENLHADVPKTSVTDAFVTPAWPCL